jgi:hypothetical protein
MTKAWKWYTVSCSFLPVEVLLQLASSCIIQNSQFKSIDYLQDQYYSYYLTKTRGKKKKLFVIMKDRLLLLESPQSNPSLSFIDATHHDHVVV